MSNQSIFKTSTYDLNSASFQGFYSNLLHEYKLIYYTQLGIYYENIKSSRDENRRALHNFKDLIATYAIELKQVILTFNI